MSSTKMGMAERRGAEAVSRVIGFGVAGALTAAAAGAVEGVVAFTIFRAIDLALFPHYGAFVMTALSSRLPIVLAVAGLLFGGIGMACFGNSLRAQENAKEALSALVRNSLIGTVGGVVVGGSIGFAIGRSQSQDPITLFSTFFAGVSLGFLLGLIGSLIASVTRKQVSGGAGR